MNSIKIPAQHQITFLLSLANPKPTRPSLIFSLYLSLHRINFWVLIKIGTCIWIQDQSFENPLKIVPIFCPSLKRSFLYINMDADSWSARLSSASKRYQSALQSRSGKLIHFFFFGLLFLCGIFKKTMEDMWTWCWKLWEFNFYLVICESICLQLMVIIFDSVFLVFCLFLYPSWLKCGICM